MKKLVLITAIVISGLLFLASCTNEYEKQKKLIIDNVQTIEEGNMLDLNMRILEFNFDTIVTTKDSLKIYLESKAYEYANDLININIQIDTLPDFVDSLNKVYERTYDMSDWRKHYKYKTSLEVKIRVSKVMRDYLYSDIQFNKYLDPTYYIKEFKEGTGIYYVYKCTYMVYNPFLSVDQTFTKHFVFNESQTKIIRKY